MTHRFDGGIDKDQRSLATGAAFSYATATVRFETLGHCSALTRRSLFCVGRADQLVQDRFLGEWNSRMGTRRGRQHDQQRFAARSAIAAPGSFQLMQID